MTTLRWMPVALAVLLAGGCSDFLDVNEDPNAPENARVDLRLPSVIGTFGHSVLFGSSSLWGAEWTQQFSYNRDLRPYTEIHRYELSQTDAQGHWDYIFSSTMNEARNVMLETEQAEDWHYHGIAKFIYAWSYSIVTDLWGPVPFTEAFDTNIPDPAYDDQQTIYAAIHTMLDEAIEAMQRQAPRTPATNDLLFGGDMSRWLKLARTVQARLHLRLAYAPGENGADRAQKALTSLQSGILNNAEDADFNYPGGENGLRNPRYTFQDLQQLVASEFVVERLRSRDDPRLPIMVTPVADSLPAIVYRGHRNGSLSEPDSTFSWIGTFFSTDSASLTWVSYAEAKFIEAEARLITSGAGAADAPYRDGIRAHMQKLGVASAAIDAYVAARPSLGSVPNALEEIMAEKHVANYLTLEAWTDWRRTGFPRLELVEGAVLPNIPYRIRTPGSELSNNAANVAATGIPTGLEGMNVKVWWASGN